MLFAKLKEWFYRRIFIMYTVVLTPSTALNI
jgi:hypothetical protein